MNRVTELVNEWLIEDEVRAQCWFAAARETLLRLTLMDGHTQDEIRERAVTVLAARVRDEVITTFSRSVEYEEIAEAFISGLDEDWS
jgi:hypothetical protein